MRVSPPFNLVPAYVELADRLVALEAPPLAQAVGGLFAEAVDRAAAEAKAVEEAKKAAEEEEMAAKARAMAKAKEEWPYPGRWAVWGKDEREERRWLAGAALTLRAWTEAAEAGAAAGEGGVSQGRGEGDAAGSVSLASSSTVAPATSGPAAASMSIPKVMSFTVHATAFASFHIIFCFWCPPRWRPLGFYCLPPPTRIARMLPPCAVGFAAPRKCAAQVIHHVWLGSPLPPRASELRASWALHHPPSRGWVRGRHIDIP